MAPSTKDEAPPSTLREVWHMACWMSSYVSAVSAAAELERDGGLAGRRRQMVRHARGAFSWRNVALMWDEEFAR